MNKHLLKNIKIERKKSATAVLLILMLTTSAMLFGIPISHAAITLTVSPHFNQFIGMNSQTKIIWTIDPNILLSDPTYANKTSTWANAKVTFTRPDGTTDAINGPITVEMGVPQGVAVNRFSLLYTPNMQGSWKVNFAWPGDGKYNPVSVTSTFNVGQQIPKRDTYAYLSMRPYPTVGLGQDLMVNVWVTPPPLTNYQTYYGYMFTITAPNGTIQKIGPIDTESEGTTWFDLFLTDLGNWTIKFDYPGDYANNPSTVTRTITVQQAAIPVGYPDTPLPTNAWDFPINVNNRNWRSISGEWLQSYYDSSQDSWNPYTDAPRSPHVLWKLPAYTGEGGYDGGAHSIQNGAAAEGDIGDMGVYPASVPSIRTVLAGRGYYVAGANIVCVDMHTGKTMWTVPGTFNVGGSRSTYGPVLYSFTSTRMVVYSGMDGSMILNTTGLSMTWWEDPFVYSYQRLNATTGAGNMIKWDTTGTSTNFTSRITWNETNNLPYTTTAHALIQGNYIISRHFLTEGVQNYGISTSNTIIVDYLVGVDKMTGKMAYNISLANPADPTTWLYRQGPAWGSGAGLVYFAGYGDFNQGRGYVAFNASTGKMAWSSQTSDYPWGNFWAYLPQASGYNMIFGLGYTGVWAFSATDGKEVWHYIDTDTYREEPYDSSVASDGTPYASYTFGSIGPVVGGGIVFAPNSEHSPTFAYRGMHLDAIDAFTGKQVWQLLASYATPTAIAYGILLYSDSWNGFTYAIGKGNSQTTVTASSKSSMRGNSLMLEGTVLDMSTAQNGTAAIADANQEAWMEYIHMQQPKPTNAQGVQVALTAVDQNGASTSIGTATSDTTGRYAIAWTPPAEGVYTITAAFKGSDSYYSSSDETSVLVTAGPTPTPLPSPVTAPNIVTQESFYAIAAAIIVLMIIAIAILLIRKK
jgi:hypothetical protein